MVHSNKTTDNVDPLSYMVEWLWVLWLIDLKKKSDRKMGISESFNHSIKVKN